MRRSLTLTAAGLLLTLAGCSSAANSGTSTDAATTPTTTVVTASSKAVAAAANATATTAMAQLAAKIPTAKQTLVITEDNDENNLIGRPHQYTSKVAFKDSRIPASEAAGAHKGDVDYGGSIEVFATPADAAARAKYIQTVTANLPALSEYDYVHGDVLVRVSHYLKPSQAKGYEAATQQIT